MQGKKNIRLLTALLSGCMAFNTVALEMKQAVEHALNYNPSYLAAQSNLDATRQGTNLARSALLPQVGASAGVNGSFRNVEGSGSMDHMERYSSDVGVRATQVIYDGTKQYGLQMAKANTKLQEISLESTRQSLIFNAIEAYVNAYKEKLLLGRKTAYEKVLKQQYYAVMAQVQVGELVSTDKNLSEAAWRGAVATKVGAQADYATSQAIFTQIIGLAAEDLSAPYSAQKALPKSYEAALAYAMQNSPQILAAEQQLELQKLSLEKAKAARYPTVTSNVSAGYSDLFSDRSYGAAYTNSERGTFQASGGVEVNVPIYTGGAVSADIEAERAKTTAAELGLANTKNTITQQLSAAWQVYLAVKEQKEALQTQILASEKSVNGVKEEYAVGARSLIDVLNEETGLINAFVSYENARANEVIASWRILLITGMLNADHI